ncbi:helix-turn-helix domain-containing protein [Terrisporobacter sp.]|uniref:helix-turn-helix domain-containing protein n=1 Tax=Terrisporobacter sp. TaxID=1965305 RepID=UPI00260BE1F5|nr:helix-turn-helix transcriptional regulator [Terrisporobacter sp.]
MYYKLNLKALNLEMLKKGYSINQLSKKSGLGKATISRLTRDKVISRPSTIYKIANALDIDVEKLLIEVEE